MGSANETDIIVGGIHTQGLLDTGSTVFTISKKKYLENLSDIQLQSIQEALSIECADGNQLPYEGYIEVDLNILNKKGKTNTDTTLPNGIFLIVSIIQ